jgi:hypothetical protein
VSSSQLTTTYLQDLEIRFVLVETISWLKPIEWLINAKTLITQNWNLNELIFMTY